MTIGSNSLDQLQAQVRAAPVPTGVLVRSATGHAALVDGGRCQLIPDRATYEVLRFSGVPEMSEGRLPSAQSMPSLAWSGLVCDGEALFWVRQGRAFRVADTDAVPYTAAFGPAVEANLAFPAAFGPSILAAAGIGSCYHHQPNRLSPPSTDSGTLRQGDQL